MALTYASKVDDYTVNGKRSVTAVVTFDDSYPTGGEAVDLTLLGLSQVDEVYVNAVAQAAAGAGAVIQADVDDPKAPALLLYTAASTEASNASDQSAVEATVRFVGT